MVPVAFGIVIVLLLPEGVANTRLLVIAPDVACSEVLALPCSVKDWPVDPIVIPADGVMVLTAKVPAIVTVVPLSVMIESPIAWLAVNLARVLVVPPDVVTPLPLPAQFPTVVQMLYVPAATVLSKL